MTAATIAAEASEKAQQAAAIAGMEPWWRSGYESGWAEGYRAGAAVAAKTPIEESKTGGKSCSP